VLQPVEGLVRRGQQPGKALWSHQRGWRSSTKEQFMLSRRKVLGNFMWGLFGSLIATSLTKKVEAG
jgi:hypothetical protein